MAIAEAPFLMQERFQSFGSKYPINGMHGVNISGQEVCWFALEWNGTLVRIGKRVAVMLPYLQPSGKDGTTTMEMLSLLSSVHGIKVFHGAKWASSRVSVRTFKDADEASAGAAHSVCKGLLDTLTYCQIKYETARKLKEQLAMAIMSAQKQFQEALYLMPDIKYSQHYELLLKRLDAGTNMERVRAINRGHRTMVKMYDSVKL
jgi:hypothetical protein